MTRYRVRFSPNWREPWDNCPEFPFCVERRGWLFWRRVDSVRYKTRNAAEQAIREIYEPEFQFGAGPK